MTTFHHARQPFRNNAEVCRGNGWGVGTRLVGDEGYGPTTIEITAIGEELLLAKTIAPRPARESTWTLSCRDWTVVEHATKAATGPTPRDEELPGMWENADLIGGETDCDG